MMNKQEEVFFDVLSIRKDITEYELYQLLDQVSISKENNLTLSLVFERGQVLFCLDESKETEEGLKSYIGTHSMEVDKFLQLSYEEIMKYVDNIYYYSMIESNE